MTKLYSTVYFDLDNTLLDFYKSEEKAIRALLKMHSLPSNEQTARLYSDINLSYWKRFERGEIKKEDIFVNRFITLLEKLGEQREAERLSNDYFGLLSEGHDVMPGAEDILEYLKGLGYILCATTNGISFTQYKRIELSGLKKYFDYIFVSEDTGFQKPTVGYFEYVMEHTPEKDKSKILIIGDSQSSDILGGINFGVDTCWLNPSGEAAVHQSRYEIKSLSELKSIL